MQTRKNGCHIRHGGEGFGHVGIWLGSLTHTYQTPVSTPAVVLEIAIQPIVHTVAFVTWRYCVDQKRIMPRRRRDARSAERSTVLRLGGALARMTSRIGSQSKNSAK